MHFQTERRNNRDRRGAVPARDRSRSRPDLVRRTPRAWILKRTGSSRAPPDSGSPTIRSALEPGLEISYQSGQLASRARGLDARARRPARERIRPRPLRLRAHDVILEVTGAVRLRPQPDPAGDRRPKHRIVRRETDPRSAALSDRQPAHSPACTRSRSCRPATP